LRFSYIPLLLLPLPLSLSPIHLTSLLILTYILNRPCIYCSLLLIILFASSCHWSGRCFFDFSTSKYGYGDWFIPRLYTQSTHLNNTMSNGTAEDETFVHFVNEIASQTISVLAGAVVEEFKIRAQHPSAAIGRNLTEPIGIGTAWLKSIFGRSQWTLPCVNVVVRL
jgi:hypothetical protein